MGVLDGACSDHYSDAKQQEVFIAIINDLCSSLHAQAVVMRRCLVLGTGLSDTFQATADAVVSQLTTVINRSREDLCYAAAPAAVPRDSSESSTRDSSRLLPPRINAPHSQISTCCADHRGCGARGSDKQEWAVPDMLIATEKPVGFPASSKPVEEADVLFKVGSEGSFKVGSEGSNGNGAQESVPMERVTNGGPPGHSNNIGIKGHEEDFELFSASPCERLSERDSKKIKFAEDDSDFLGDLSEEDDKVNNDVDGGSAPSELDMELDLKFENSHETGEENEATPSADARRVSLNSRGSLKSGIGTVKNAIKRLSSNSMEDPPSRSPRQSQVNMAKRMSFCEQLELSEDADFDALPAGKCVDGVMNPNWPGRLSWDMGVIMLVSIDAMVLPFQIAYKDGQEPDGFDVFWLWMTTAFFAVDMIASFLTAYAAGKSDPELAPGKLVTSKTRIARNYLKTWFAIDFASTIPWGKFADMLSGGGSSARSAQMAKLTKVVKFVRFLRLMRMLRLAKLAVIWERVEASMGNLILKQSVALIRVIFVLIGICHWNACIWWLVGQQESLFTELLSEESRAAYEKMPHWTTTVRKTGEEEWRWTDRDRHSQYIFCFYWTLGVMRTMPAEVQPENTAERLYIMVFMFFAFSAFAICVALITQTFFKFSERKRNFDEDMAAVRMYMRQIKVDDNVQNSVKLFLRHLFDRRKIQARENSMLSHLPSSLTSHLKHDRLNEHLMKLGVFDNLPSKAVYYVSELAEIRDIAPGACLSRRGRRAEAAFVLMNGRLSVQGLDQGFHVQTLEVVDAECLLASQQIVVSTRTVISCACSEVIKIDRVKFFDMLRKNEEFKRTWSFKVFDIDESCRAEPEASEALKAEVNEHREAAIATTAAIVAS